MRRSYVAGERVLGAEGVFGAFDSAGLVIEEPQISEIAEIVKDPNKAIAHKEFVHALIRLVDVLEGYLNLGGDLDGHAVHDGTDSGPYRPLSLFAAACIRTNRNRRNRRR